MTRDGSSNGMSAAETKLKRLCEGIACSLVPDESSPPIICCATRQDKPIRENVRWGVHRNVSSGHGFMFPIGGSLGVDTSEGLKHVSPGQILLVGRGVLTDESPLDPERRVPVNWCYTRHSYALLGQHVWEPATGWQSSRKLEVLGRTDVESIAAAVLAEVSRKSFGWRDASSALLRYLSWILVRRIRLGSLRRLEADESPTVSTDPEAWRIVQATLDYCDQNFRRPFRLEEVAHAVGYSESYLCRLFSRHVGRPLFRCIRDLRIREAKRLLESTGMRMKEISHAVGYSDPTQFSRSFKRETGVSPVEYRRAAPSE